MPGAVDVGVVAVGRLVLDVRGNATVVNAFVPLANMFGYVNNLRGMSQGRAQFTMQYDHYDPVPQHVADEVIKKYSA